TRWLHASVRAIGCLDDSARACGSSPGLQGAISRPSGERKAGPSVPGPNAALNGRSPMAHSCQFGTENYPPPDAALTKLGIQTRCPYTLWVAVQCVRT